MGLLHPLNSRGRRPIGAYKGWGNKHSLTTRRLWCLPRARRIQRCPFRCRCSSRQWGSKGWVGLLWSLLLMDRHSFWALDILSLLVFWVLTCHWMYELPGRKITVWKLCVLISELFHAAPHLTLPLLNEEERHVWNNGLQTTKKAHSQGDPFYFRKQNA